MIYLISEWCRQANSIRRRGHFWNCYFKFSEFDKGGVATSVVQVRWMPPSQLHGEFPWSLYYNYNHFTALWILSGTTRVSRHQKCKTKTDLDFLEQETMSGSGISWAMQICISSQTDNHASTPPLESVSEDILKIGLHSQKLWPSDLL